MTTVLNSLISILSTRRKSEPSKRLYQNTIPDPAPKVVPPPPERKKERPKDLNLKHLLAIHSEPRTSCLSHDSTTSPSFLGFRNLMVIVLGESTAPGSFGGRC
jgi:hypothetical protein